MIERVYGARQMAPAMNRYTFVVHAHPEGISTLENLSTHEQVQVSDMADVGPQIERWLAELIAAESAAGAAAEAGAGQPGA
jgi:hypothetical protein